MVYQVFKAIVMRDLCHSLVVVHEKILHRMPCSASKFKNKQLYLGNFRFVFDVGIVLPSNTVPP